MAWLDSLPAATFPSTRHTPLILDTAPPTLITLKRVLDSILSLATDIMVDTDVLGPTGAPPPPPPPAPPSPFAELSANPTANADADAVAAHQTPACASPDYQSSSITPLIRSISGALTRAVPAHCLNCHSTPSKPDPNDDPPCATPPRGTIASPSLLSRSVGQRIQDFERLCATPR